MFYLFVVLVLWMLSASIVSLSVIVVVAALGMPLTLVPFFVSLLSAPCMWGNRFLNAFR